MRVGETIYLDHQATTPTDRRVVELMAPFFCETFGNPHSTDHIFGWNATKAIDNAAAQVGALIGADPDEIVFTSGATEANNLALLGLAQDSANRKRNRILVSAIEHKSILAVSRILRDQFNFRIDSIPVDEDGVISLSALNKLIDEDVLLVSSMLINNEIGSILPYREFSKTVSAAGAFFHVDCAQAPGIIDLSTISQHVDLISLSGHKMYGPKGIGALYIRRNIQGHVHPIIHGGGQQNHLRSGTLPTPLCVGMGAAAEIASSSLGETIEIIRQRRNRLIDGLSCLRWPTRLNGPSVISRHPGNANILFEDFTASDILATLQPRLAASTGAACTSGIPEPSHVLRAIGLTDAEAESSIRFSLGRFTTDKDVDDAVTLIEETLTRLERHSFAAIT